MLDTNEIHEQVQEMDRFEVLVDGLNERQSLHELISAIEGIGREIDNEREDYRADELDHITLGWLRVVWEAHHPGEVQDSLEPEWR